MFSKRHLFTLMIALSVSCAALAGEKVLNFAITTEPPQLNATKATDQQSFFVLGHIMEGLTRYGDGDKSIPGVAEKWKIGDKEAIFNLRKNAKWSDGKPVTAKDFVYGWRMVVDPKNASEYAFIMYPIKNAEAINTGKAKLETLGVEAVDDYTLKVTFEKPCGYFLGLTAFPSYYPHREDFVKAQGEKYGANAENLMTNGPFKLTKWTHGASLRMEKNANYWNKAKVNLDAIDIPYITPDNNARFNLFKDKKLHLLEGIGKDDLPKAQAEHFKMKNHMDGSVFFMEFHFRDGKPTKNIHLRKAIQLVFNVDEYVQKVISIPGTKPGRTLVPVWVGGVKDKFRKEFPYPTVKVDLAKAKKEIELAKKDMGGKIPSLVWLTGDSPAADREAQYFQRVFKDALGIELRIDKQIFKQRLAKMTSGDFDIVAAGWGPDFADPMTFAELKASWNENNRGKYSNPKYDELIRKAQSTSDNKIRMKAMADAEKMVLDDLAVLPTYERAIVWVQHDNVTGIVRHVIGPDPDFTNANVK